MVISYKENPSLSVEDFMEILEKSTLGQRRPMQDVAAMQLMLDNANVYVGAYDGEKLVGLARGMTDFVFTTYLADLAVDEAYQHHGIGKQLLKKVKNMHPRAKLILLAAPAAQEYYPKIGMQKHDYCFFIIDVQEIQ
ncbi:GNAT family N-acetyltransferase [Aquirufa ecclesiirivi]|uniref:GNAT family N-acetyltransferase n=1 Tax=Aquirufa ecclesiirivi TaxID=2715124 RepID=A0ABT4JFV1_9BACT|nr:GNAT family N-acetyltransferase [Aquirufa ecclesiirivi]MCZ2475142.1 GNAT family N-acetyltransferase [Aquirufa ecclesiirivi]MDF0692441.1 GNAT family N-acetyltransferase [Aquirufa ecclesiirivi]